MVFIMIASGAGIIVAFMAFMRVMVWFNVAHDGFNTANRAELSALRPRTYANAPGEVAQHE